MIRINQLKVRMPHNKDALPQAVCKAIHISSEEIEDIKIKRKSLDARKKPDIFAVYTVDVELKSTKREKGILNNKKIKNVTTSKEIKYTFPKSGDQKIMNRPVIIGFGPAGMFCGLLLARAGYKPLILERGQDVDARSQVVEQFWKTGILSERTNVQFGEGGAGTFSDGKLNTLVKDVSGRNTKVLEEFVKAGAKEEILYLHKPHIGTDELKKIVKNIRTEIESLGGEIRFDSQVTDLVYENTKNEVNNVNRQLTGIEVNHEEQLETNVIVLAIGHSARDTFYMLKKQSIPMQAKAFAVGVRMEHPQKMINHSQYGMEEAEYLGAADYKLTAKTSNGRGVYSFCMCPGGYVVNASSELEHLAVNGMSYSKRDGENANSAIIVTVNTEDFPSTDVLGGIELQRQLEKAAYLSGEGKVPIQLYGDFKKNQISKTLGEVQPCIRGNYQFSDVRSIFPESLSKSLIEGIESFEHKIKGFTRDDAILSGVESRTSSPVRIIRNEEFESEVTGLYPCGEGAGYAGGITSAAMDGIKVAEAIAKKYKVVI